jgi:hypothetical protein
LAAFANNEVSPDSEISLKVNNSHNLAKAAVVARASLPRARASLDDEQSRLVQLRDQRQIAVRTFLLNIANERARKYAKAVHEMVTAHDELCGISNALPPLKHDAAIRLNEMMVKLPSFALPAVDSSPWYTEGQLIQHTASDRTITEVSTKWRQAFDRLMVDTEADVSDLLEVAP